MTTATAPFRPSSMLYKIWVIALKGTTLNEIVKRCQKEGANATWLLRTLRRCARRDWTWKVQEESGRFKIYDVRHT